MTSPRSMVISFGFVIFGLVSRSVFTEKCFLMDFTDMKEEVKHFLSYHRNKLIGNRSLFCLEIEENKATII